MNSAMQLISYIIFLHFVIHPIKGHRHQDSLLLINSQVHRPNFTKLEMLILSESANQIQLIGLEMQKNSQCHGCSAFVMHSQDLSTLSPEGHKLLRNAKQLRDNIVDKNHHHASFMGLFRHNMA